MLKTSLLCLYIILFFKVANAQEFVECWPKGTIPYSKELNIKDSIARERVFEVETPGMYSFFPSKDENKGAAVLIYPGGGYHHLAYQISGFQLAKWFNTMGISAFVLNYRLPVSKNLTNQTLAPLADAQRAMQVVRAHAEKWGIDPQKIGVMGCSAGGHLAALQSNFKEDVTLAKDSLVKYSFLPNFTILVSPVIDMGEFAHKGSRENLLGKTPSEEMIKKFSAQLLVTKQTPICFIADAFNDKTVNPQNSLLYYQALLKQQIPTSFHVFPQGGHAIALRNNPGSTEQWTNLCEAWLLESGIIPETKL